MNVSGDSGNKVEARSRQLSVLSPYPIPAALNGRKVCNLGDGFILRAIERHLGLTMPMQNVMSPRIAQDALSKHLMSSTRATILAGANQLNDRFTIWPGLTAAELEESAYCFIPFGLGIHGEVGFNTRMSSETARILEIVHERIPYSSWRCPLTIEYLHRSLPHLRQQFLMTGCPVVYDSGLLQSERFSSAEDSVAVTATERGNFWERETAILRATARRFPKAQKYFVVHQNFSPPRPLEGLRHRFTLPRISYIEDKVESLRAYARSLDFKVVIPQGADECMSFYSGVDVHVGTRLHAHLLFLSHNKRSYLVPVDDRATGIANFLGFPLSAASELDRAWDFDFEIVRRNALDTYPTMQQFIRSICI
jgi:hypothetical protein